jgi:hypothetical protein
MRVVLEEYGKKHEVEENETSGVKKNDGVKRGSM